MANLIRWEVFLINLEGKIIKAKITKNFDLCAEQKIVAEKKEMHAMLLK